MFKRLSVLLIVPMLVAACLTPAVTSQPTETPSALPTTVPPTAVPPATTPSTASEPTGTHVAVDLTPAQLAAVQALAADQNASVDQIKIVSTEAAQWSDRCLGVVLPGVTCAQGPVDGFVIILALNGQNYEYHADQTGEDVIAAAPRLASIRIAVRAADNSVVVVDTTTPLDLASLPAATGFLPAGGLAGGVIYALDLSSATRAVAVPITDGSATGEPQTLDFIQNASYALPVWPGDAATGPRLAWGTQPASPDSPNELFYSAPDGSMLDTLLSEPFPADMPSILVAERWSADGQSLYFSREPYGIGGYIPFSGASSLYRVTLADKQVTELIPFSSQGGMICLDAMSRDERLVAGRCDQQNVTVTDLTNGQTTTIAPPADLTDFGTLGSARFSPDGSRLAFALAKGDPSNEQGWVAVSDGLSGNSTVIATGQPGQYFTVAAWLNADTLLLQSYGLTCDPQCGNELWTVKADGGDLLKVADGTFVTLVDGYQP